MHRLSKGVRKKRLDIGNVAISVYERVDGFLTLIFDETKINLIGFKLKGFKCIFEKHLKPLFELHDKQFIDLVSAIEAVFTDAGNQIFSVGDEARARAYKAALKLAHNDNVRLYGLHLKEFAVLWRKRHNTG